ncbi:MAG TPA: acyl-CoA dehydrogenase family protein [Solirubrobacteraceae bacterium]|jgi:acyl-CoA dehydrogenase
MSYERELLIEAVLGVLGQHEPEEATELQTPFDESLWSSLHDHGFTLVGIADEAGGAGGELADAVAVASCSGRMAAAVPLADSALVGAWVAANAGLPFGDPGPVAAPLNPTAIAGRPTGDGWHVHGSLGVVPWATAAASFLALVTADGGAFVALCPAADAAVSANRNLAGEPAGVVRVEVELPSERVVPAPSWLTPKIVRVRGALARAAMMSGAMERALELTIFYVTQRRQFGRTLSRFQAVQQQVAEMAAEVAAAKAALQLAVDSDAAPRAVAAAKIRCGLAAGRTATIAHQLHGAIGFTDEYQLHRFTRRLWAWRDEFGSEADWSHELGRELLAGAASGLWPALSAA